MAKREAIRPNASSNLGLVWHIAIYLLSLTAPNRTTMEMTAKARTHSSVYELRITLDSSADLATDPGPKHPPSMLPSRCAPNRHGLDG
jgi:hypothetical protein